MRRLVNIVYWMMKLRTAYGMPELPEEPGRMTTVAASAKDAATVLAFCDVVLG